MASGYQLKITIKYSHPPIWRRVVVPESITFNDLDNIIQAVFGWEHEHMFDFYFKKSDVHFGGSPVYEPGGEADECIDEWIHKGAAFLYTYDFGDNWEHTVEVESIIEYDNRFPQVLKYKGPNMIEDCGGIWRFSSCRNEAPEFDMDGMNELFQSWHLPIVVPDSSDKGKNFERKQELRTHWYEDEEESNESQFIKLLNEFMGYEDSMRENMDEIEELTHVFQCYSKDNLKELARAHGFSGYSRFNKKELAEWLKNHLLETRYMREFIENSGEEEFSLFEEAIEEKGISVSESLISESLLLCSYGGYTSGADFYQVPLDVQEKFKKIATPEFREKKEKQMNFIIWCDAVVYLYGVISVEKFAELYNKYEDASLEEAEFKRMLTEAVGKRDAYAFIDDWFMDSELAEEDMYKALLKHQESYEYYLPESREEFLDYGRYECQQPDEEVQFFLDYIQYTAHIERPQAIMAYYELQEAIRDNAEDMELITIMDEVGCQVTTPEKMKKVMDLLYRLGGYIRKWEYKGHTSNEIKKERARNSKNVKGNGKIISFASAKKVYPNDPCPCGSGKKYKHCCGKNK